MTVNLDAAILIANIDTESIKSARLEEDPFLLRFQNGKQLTVDEIRVFLRAQPEEFDAAISVLKLELELSKGQGAENHDDL